MRATFSALKTHKRLAVYTDYHEPRVYWEYLKTTTGSLGNGLLYLQFLCPTDMIIHTALNLLYGTQFEASQSSENAVLDTFNMFPPAANIDLASKMTSLSVYLLHFLAELMTNSSSIEF